MHAGALAITISNTPVSFNPSDSAIVIGDHSSIHIPAPAPAPKPITTILSLPNDKTLTFAPAPVPSGTNSPAGVVIGSHTLKAGGPANTIGSVVYSVVSDGGALAIGNTGGEVMTVSIPQPTPDIGGLIHSVWDGSPTALTTATYNGPAILPAPGGGGGGTNGTDVGGVPIIPGAATKGTRVGWTVVAAAVLGLLVVL